jgi:hypothetical protein
MAFVPHQRLVKTFTTYAIDGGVKRAMKTVDDGFRDEETGEFRSGAIRDLEITLEEAAEYFNAGLLVTEAQVLELRQQLADEWAKVKRFTDLAAELKGD